MNSAIRPQLFISPKTRSLGMKLIKEFNILQYSDLTAYLEVNSCYDGQQATLIWLEHRLEENSCLEFAEVRKMFLQCFPESCYNFT